MRHLSFWVISLVLGVRLVFGATGRVARSGLGRFATFAKVSRNAPAARSVGYRLRDCAWEI